MYIYPVEATVLESLGNRLRARRIERGDTQADFACRVGVSIPTYRKMEQGSEKVPIGYWVRALRMLDDLASLEHVLPVCLFSEGQGRQRRKRRAPEKSLKA